MEDHPVEYLAAKMLLLEKEVGWKPPRDPLDPFPLDPNDAKQVDEAARLIAGFVGLARSALVVISSPLHEGVGGQIELGSSYGPLYVRVARALRVSPDAVLATLAHEITHKFLQVNPNLNLNRVGGQTWFEDETLTDIAAVWLGLGKLMLNGCQWIATTRSGPETTTTQGTVGYLSPAQFAFVYLLVSSIRGLSEEDCKRGLSANALYLLRKARQDYGNCLDNDWIESRLQSLGLAPLVELDADGAEQAIEPEPALSEGAAGGPRFNTPSRGSTFGDRVRLGLVLFFVGLATAPFWMPLLRALLSR